MSKGTFREAGWVWEGLGFDPGVEPSIYGVGEGAEYFDLDRANFMFHPNNEVTLGKLAKITEVVPEITKWKWLEIPPDDGPGGYGFRNWCDGRPETMEQEAAKLSDLSQQFPNVTGALIDDTHIVFRAEGYNAGWPQRIYEALHSANPDLKLWLVVYTHELDMAEWEPFLPYMDIANLWVWNATDLRDLAAQVARCAEVFPGKKIIVGSYLRDYPTRAPVPLDLMATQYETMLRLWEEQKISGYSILGACLIDQHPAQAEWVRGFIARHS